MIKWPLENTRRDTKIVILQSHDSCALVYGSECCTLRIEQKTEEMLSLFVAKLLLTPI